MSVLLKNQSYVLRKIDPVAGFGLLYSSENDDCALLNPIATEIWNSPTDMVDAARDGIELQNELAIPGMAAYFNKIVADMKTRGVLIESGQALEHGFVAPLSQAKNVRSNGDYPLIQIYFNVTEKCNAACYHCWQPTLNVPNAALPPKKGEVTANEFLRFVETALPLGLKRVKFTGGEPLLRADLPEMIKGATRMGLTTAIESNGFMVTEAIADILAENKVEISMSLDAATPQKHDKLRNHAGSFDKVTFALRLLCKRGCEPHIIMSVSKLNYDDIEGTLKHVAQNGGRYLKINLVSKFGAASCLSDTVLLTLDQVKNLYDARRGLEIQYDMFLHIDGPPSFSSVLDIATGHVAVCPFINMLGVLPNGNISFCGIGNSCPEMVFGNINDEGLDLRHLWQTNELLLSVRRQLRTRLDGICGQCILEPLCKGSCRAMAYSGTRSYTAPHPWCQMAFDKGLFPSDYLINQPKLETING